MAMITQFEPMPLNRPSQHDAIKASYASFQHGDRMILQINTSGRVTREQPGKQSQTLQLDRDSAAQLIEILRRTFGL